MLLILLFVYNVFWYIICVIREVTSHFWNIWTSTFNIINILNVINVLMLLVCVNNLYFKKIVSFPMCELQYMFAADMFSVSCLNTMLQGKGGGAVNSRHSLIILGCSTVTIEKVSTCFTTVGTSHWEGDIWSLRGGFRVSVV